jgi:NAD(P)H-flavin reductase
VTRSAVEGRTLAPAGRRVARVGRVERLGAYTLIGALDADGPRDPRPGQFYMLASAERWGGGEGQRPYLPRAFSYARAREAPGGTELEFLLEDVGPGTARLAELRPGDGLALVGPLGIGFRAEPAPDRPLIVGGGIGTAPLLCLAELLGPEGQVMLGFRSAAHAEAAALFPGRPAVATDDGSHGHAGLVTDLLRDALDEGRAGAHVYACGPPPMLEAIRALCEQAGVPAQLALESGMACGYGACFGCVVQTKSGYIRLCLDGPVIDASELSHVPAH